MRVTLDASDIRLVTEIEGDLSWRQDALKAADQLASEGRIMSDNVERGMEVAIEMPRGI